VIPFGPGTAHWLTIFSPSVVLRITKEREIGGL
jgi:hypothetical protein